MVDFNTHKNESQELFLLLSIGNEAHIFITSILNSYVILFSAIPTTYILW